MGGGPAANLRYRFSRRVLTYAHLRLHSAVPFERRFRLLERLCSTRLCEPMTVPPTIRLTTSRRRGEDKYRIMTAVAGWRERHRDHRAGEPARHRQTRRAARRRHDLPLPRHRDVRCRAPLQPRRPRQDRRCDAGDGVLQLDLERKLPEAMKPRRIAVESKPASGTKVIEGKKSA
jgi:molecular chaperone IbpA